MPRYFTRDQARRQLPQISEKMKQALHLRRENQSAEQELEGMERKVMMSGGMIVNHTKLLEARARRDAAARRLGGILEEIHAEGIQVKDLDIGLVDFPTLYHGREVLLCWRVGEGDIGFWHGLEEGFQGRKPIDAEFEENHRDGVE